jgi:hypothetical protein
MKDAIEAFGVLLVVIGVGLWSVPAAFVVAGLAVVLAMEVRA